MSKENTIKLVKIHEQSPTKSSLDMIVEVNGKEYSFAIRFMFNDKNNEIDKLTILKDASWWHVETSTFGHPYED
jgi:hypothetical protein